MSLLKEGDEVNFQRASCTLDGCVKIYTNRVDSVATETGRLLNGLATSRQNSDKEGGTDRNEDESHIEGEDRPKKKKATHRTNESTLVTSPDQAPALLYLTMRARRQIAVRRSSHRGIHRG